MNIAQVARRTITTATIAAVVVTLFHYEWGTEWGHAIEGWPKTLFIDQAKISTYLETGLLAAVMYFSWRYHYNQIEFERQVNENQTYLLSLVDASPWEALLKRLHSEYEGKVKELRTETGRDNSQMNMLARRAHKRSMSQLDQEVGDKLKKLRQLASAMQQEGMDISPEVSAALH